MHLIKAFLTAWLWRDPDPIARRFSGQGRVPPIARNGLYGFAACTSIYLLIDSAISRLPRLGGFGFDRWMLYLAGSLYILGLALLVPLYLRKIGGDQIWRDIAQTPIRNAQVQSLLFRGAFRWIAIPGLLILFGTHLVRVFVIPLFYGIENINDLGGGRIATDVYILIFYLVLLPILELAMNIAIGLKWAIRFRGSPASAVPTLAVILTFLVGAGLLLKDQAVWIMTGLFATIVLIRGISVKIWKVKRIFFAWVQAVGLLWALTLTVLLVQMAGGFSSLAPHLTGSPGTQITGAGALIQFLSVIMAFVGLVVIVARARTLPQSVFLSLLLLVGPAFAVAALYPLPAMNPDAYTTSSGLPLLPVNAFLALLWAIKADYAISCYDEIGDKWRNLLPRDLQPEKDDRPIIRRPEPGAKPTRRRFGALKDFRTPKP